MDETTTLTHKFTTSDGADSGAAAAGALRLRETPGTIGLTVATEWNVLHQGFYCSPTPIQYNGHFSQRSDGDIATDSELGPITRR
jgi:hypothetical protein